MFAAWLKVIADEVSQPWWLAAIVVPLAGFSAWLVKWILDRQDKLHAENKERDANREKREDARAAQAELQTRAMQDCVVQLARIHQTQVDCQRAIAGIPEQTVDQLLKRRAV